MAARFEPGIVPGFSLFYEVLRTSCPAGFGGRLLRLSTWVVRRAFRFLRCSAPQTSLIYRYPLFL